MRLLPCCAVCIATAMAMASCSSGLRAGASINAKALHRLLARMQVAVTVHGFRSAFRDWAGETTAFPHDICEAALAHVRGDKSVQAYARGDLFNKRCKLMEAWAKFCTSPPKATAANLVAMREHAS